MLVEKVEPGRGDEGPDGFVMVKERVAVVAAVPVVDVERMGLRAGSLSETGTGRRRLRIDGAAGRGSWSMFGVPFGRGGGGDAGGEC